MNPVPRASVVAGVLGLLGLITTVVLAMRGGSGELPTYVGLATLVVLLFALALFERSGHLSVSVAVPRLVFEYAILLVAGASSLVGILYLLTPASRSFKYGLTQAALLQQSLFLAGLFFVLLARRPLRAASTRRVMHAVVVIVVLLNVAVNGFLTVRSVDLLTMAFSPMYLIFSLVGLLYALHRLQRGYADRGQGGR